MVNVMWDETPTARTFHECSLCGRTISPGEQYRRSRIIGDDGPYTFKECVHCREFCKLYADEFTFDSDEGYTEVDVAEWEPDDVEAIEHRRRFLIRWTHGRDLFPVPGQELVAADQ
ncbi:conserved hypothetical protein [uncultured Mycobacterium sp.]|uniref:Uncharacterized protein n=1 Tax=uncultured Mycobacterium sp. TaxID=171292 RepID=A0A1Y5P5D0_9MYCO|nr:conserved hypothetical protein [uncultured Mycobacterium sp.]